MMKKILFFLSLFFVFLSFYPTLYEIRAAKNLPQDRAFELVHNYVFDYNFYLSRIREGGEGRWLVTEKYYNRPHTPSLFQIFYLLLGKVGGLDGLEPPVIYHSARVILGLVLLVLLGKLVSNYFTGIWQIVAYLFVVSAGSWPILVKLADNTYRFSTHWGGWSVIDPLARITFIPHVLLGQIFLVLFVWKFSKVGVNKAAEAGHDFFAHPFVALLLRASLPKQQSVYPERSEGLKKHSLPAAVILGFIAGIIFPPVLITIYAIFMVMTMLELYGGSRDKLGMTNIILPKMIFVIFSLPALLYTQIMFKIEPWKALAVFDIQHRSILPYWEFALALGPMLPLGVLGGLVVLGKLGEREERLIPIVSWIIAIFLLFAVFERVPQQSPTRFTQMLINVPLGILATYLFQYIYSRLTKNKRPHEIGQLGEWGRWGAIGVMGGIILMGLGVMLSSLGWQMDQVQGKSKGTWRYPVGTQLVYPLKDFMDGIDFLRVNTKTTDVVLAYEAAGNYIPAYAGNYVYLGHANTPDEDGKLKIAKEFFSGKMNSDEAKEFLLKERISYIYYGFQEQDLGMTEDINTLYPFVVSIYKNNQVKVYQVKN